MDCTGLFQNAAEAGRKLNIVDKQLIDDVLLTLSEETIKNIRYLTEENLKDLEAMGRSDPRYDRLLLTPERIRSIASDITAVMKLENPSGRIRSGYLRPDGLRVSRISVPFGVIGIIYESRPNVTFDVFSLCLKSGNACILKGGSEAINSNTAIVNIIKSVLGKHNLSADTVTLLPPGREETIQLLNARDFVDLIIPRGSRQLIDYVRKNAVIPVIETGAGICHTYFDEHGDREKGRLIINNAKTRRVSVCNALDCLIIHEKRLDDLAYLVGLCQEAKVIIYADEQAYGHLKGRYPEELLLPADKDSYGTEFLSYKMAVKSVRSFSEALNHISSYGSKHSEAIISEDKERIRMFFSMVDASSVYSNASTAFTDGAQFGLGAEIGISTQKLHARGPMALEELTTYKWIIEGNGHIRP